MSITIEQNKELSVYNTLRIQCFAERFTRVQTREELIEAVQSETDYFIIGGGSNIAITSPVIKSLVIVNAYKELTILSETGDSVTIKVSSGYPMSLLVKETVSKGWAGFEHHLGLPGTLGGAIAMNSNWFVDNKPLYVSDSLLSATIICSKGNIQEVPRSYFNFAYDYSIIRETQEVIIDAKFTLQKQSIESLTKTMKASHEYRSKSQPKGLPTAGCYFMNITPEEQKKHNLPTVSAGYLIDKAGLKGYTYGGFKVSDHHANFILNHNNGKAEELKTLTDHIRKTVHSTFGIELQNEVIQL